MDIKKRLFTALRFPEETIHQIAVVQNILENIDPEARYVKPITNFHLTLYFIGYSQNLDIVETSFENACKQYRNNINKPISINFTRINQFKRKNGNIVYLEVKENNEMIRLSEYIPNNLEKNGIEVKRQKFKAHITLARKYNGIIPKDIFLPENIIINNAALVWSHRDKNNILVYDNIIKCALTNI